ncbi:probable signal peptidase, partial [Thalassiosira pseudonana CCMP1335]
FNPESAAPRIISAFQRDWRTYTLALCVALTPIPLSLAARNFVSFYVIPSASMEPTLLKGDVLVVEKFPGVYQRTRRGDVILFQPPPSLKEIVSNSGSQLSSTSLFVKRVVGLPGDIDVRLVQDNNVEINGKQAVGPKRDTCTDEPLRLIDKLLVNGKGTNLDRLGEDDVFVLGDCKAVSVDSRVFGTLPKQNVVGKPFARIWPLHRFKV